MTYNLIKINKIISILVPTILSTALFSGTAMAASSGTVKGYIKFYQHQGNYCPTTRSCTGAKYLQSQYHTNRPIKNVKVYIRRDSDETWIGTGTTNSSGYFSISWSDPAASGNVVADLIWRGENKDNRFRVAGPDGEMRVFWSSSFTLVKGTSTNIGTKVWGSSTSPNSAANLYDGTSMAWENSLSQSNRMSTYFPNAEVRSFSDGCGTGGSCATASNDRIWIFPEGRAYNPQSDVMHEMGHIASYKASRDQNFRWGGDYSRDGGSGWGYTTPEYAAVHFEEGVVSHLADVGLYFQNANQPHTCRTATACATNSFNLETSLGTSCASGANRHAINAMRYFWDNYDSLSDYTGENLSRGVWEVVDTIHAFDNGTSNTSHVKDEPWNSGYTALDDRDGRSCVDFRENWKTWGTDSSTQLANNCGSAGD